MWEWIKSIFGSKKRDEAVVIPLPKVNTEKPAPKVEAPAQPVEKPWVVPSFDMKGKSKREIEKKLEQMLDERCLKLFGEDFKRAVEMKDANLIVWMANKALVGTREATNHNDGEVVEEIQETIGGHDHESWCMSEQQSCIAYAEVKTGIASWIHASEGCLDTADKSPKAARVKREQLKKGDLWIWQHGKTWKGHTACHDKTLDSSKAALIEGNTESGTQANGKIVREGGGTYETIRLFAGNGDMSVYAFLRPFDESAQAKMMAS